MKKISRTVEDLPYLYRFYDLDGSLRIQETLDKINEYYFPLTGKNLTQIPPDDTDYM
jgi:hypothetical protein